MIKGHIRKDDKGVSPVIAIILMVAITVVLAGVLYVWVMRIAEPPPDPISFPSAKIELRTGSDGMNYLIIRQDSGESIKWSEYKVMITGKDSLLEQVTLSGLSGTQNLGEKKVFTDNTTYPGGTVVPAIGDITLKINDIYTVDIFHIETLQRVKTADVPVILNE